MIRHQGTASLLAWALVRVGSHVTAAYVRDEYRQSEIGKSTMDSNVTDNHRRLLSPDISHDLPNMPPCGA